MNDRTARYELRGPTIWDKDDGRPYPDLPLTLDTVCSLLNLAERENARYARLKRALEQAVGRGSIPAGESALLYLLEEEG